VKGLLLKDWYQMKAYCKSFLLIVVVFLGASCFGDGNLFFVFYPCIISALIPITLLGYDERSRWNTYAGTLPVTKEQVVSAKYLLGLLLQCTIFLLTAGTQAIRLSMSDVFSWDTYWLMLGMVFALSVGSSGLCLPFLFKFGVEKGRLVYYVAIGLVCAASALFSTGMDVAGEGGLQPGGWLVAVCLVCAALYGLSWYLSIRLYRRRDSW